MCSPELIHVSNPAVEIVDVFTFKCTACNEEFNPDDVEAKCPKCKANLFEPMKKGVFKALLIDSLNALKISTEKIDAFMANKIRVRDMGICTELSVVIDLNFQVKFGGQYKSFLILMTIQILTYCVTG